MLRARIATRADVPALAAASAGAFRSDPGWRWVVGDLDRRDARAEVAVAAEAAVQVRDGHTATTHDRAGAAPAAPPGTGRGTGAHLASSEPEDVPFDEGHGFRVPATISPDGAPPHPLMWRDPRPVEAS